MIQETKYKSVFGHCICCLSFNAVEPMSKSVPFSWAVSSAASSSKSPAKGSFFGALNGDPVPSAMTASHRESSPFVSTYPSKMTVLIKIPMTIGGTKYLW